MSILDDAIREHLELKRAHGADDAELKKLEDEAFGPAERPGETVDPLAEAPTEFMTAPESADVEQAPEEGGEKEPPRERGVQIADLQEAPGPVEPEEPPEEEHPAMEHEIVDAGAPAPETEIEGGPTTEERHAIAEQPTEMFDVQGEFESSEAEAPSEEQLLDAELAEPRLAPVDPLPAEEDEPEDEFDDFFSEQRLSDELNQALEAPLEPLELEEPEVEEGEGYSEDELADEDDGGELGEDDEPEAEHTEEHDPVDRAPQPEPGHEDVLEDTPEFLEDAPEDDNLWFEQKPPKDFDFDD